MLSTIMGILHNLSKRVSTRGTFSSCQALDVLLPLLKTEVMIYAAKSLLILAYLTDEENNHIIMADEGKYSFAFKEKAKSVGANINCVNQRSVAPPYPCWEQFYIQVCALVAPSFPLRTYFCLWVTIGNDSFCTKLMF